MPTPHRRISGSLWTDTLPPDERAVAATPSTIATPDGGGVDVIVVGAGFTGLWTAWHLRRLDPTVRVVVLEREHVGFGASGRNGGWCSALLPMGLHKIAARHGAPAARRMRLAMQDTVREIGTFAAEHAPAGVFHPGGNIDLARSAPQAGRLRAELDELRHFGFGEDDARWLDAEEAAAACRATGVVGAVHTPHCATVHPLRLTHALGRAAIAAGVRVIEGVDVAEIGPRRVVTDHGTLVADVVVRATEGYTPQLAGLRREVLPIYSLMIATEPLPESVWAEIGLAERPTFADARHLVIYGQRTADGRLAFGGRGAPYHFGSAIRPEFDTHDAIREHLVHELREMFPVLADVAVTHHWGGVLAAPRDWTCSVRFDRASGMASAGGYVGDGVATTHLAGRTLAALITGSDDEQDRELVRLPWVGHRSRRWEPEPFRWIGVNAARWAARRGDVVEARTGEPSRLWGGTVDRLLGR